MSGDGELEAGPRGSAVSRGCHGGVGHKERGRGTEGGDKRGSGGWRWRMQREEIFPENAVAKAAVCTLPSFCRRTPSGSPLEVVLYKI
jgi:hypothetical protein